MANSLYEKDRAHYDSPTDALNRVQFIRNTCTNWRETAGRVGVPLHPIVLATSRSYHAVVETNRREQASLPATLTVAGR